MGNENLKPEAPPGYRWTDRQTEGTYWELLPKRGRVAAEIVLDDDTRRWCWYVAMPAGWRNGLHNPSGWACSREAALAICNAIIVGTIAPTG